MERIPSAREEFQSLPDGQVVLLQGELHTPAVVVRRRSAVIQHHAMHSPQGHRSSPDGGILAGGGQQPAPCPGAKARDRLNVEEFKRPIFIFREQRIDAGEHAQLRGLGHLRRVLDDTQLRGARLRRLLLRSLPCGWRHISIASAARRLTSATVRPFFITFDPADATAINPFARRLGDSQLTDK